MSWHKTEYVHFLAHKKINVHTRASVIFEENRLSLQMNLANQHDHSDDREPWERSHSNAAPSRNTRRPKIYTVKLAIWLLKAQGPTSSSDEKKFFIKEVICNMTEFLLSYQWEPVSQPKSKSAVCHCHWEIIFLCPLGGQIKLSIFFARVPATLGLQVF